MHQQELVKRRTRFHIFPGCQGQLERHGLKLPLPVMAMAMIRMPVVKELRPSSFQALV